VVESSPRREQVTLAVLPRGGEPAVVVPPGLAGVPVYRGPGWVDYVCGACGAILCCGVSRGMFSSLAFACQCGAVSALR
jgi:hypothetical protein